MFMHRDMMEVKLEINGATYYFSNVEQLQRSLEDGIHGSKLGRMANYIIEGGRFVKNRNTGHELPNAILAIGREEINELFDFMENNG
jgi:YHS domain-containing protein